MGATVVVNIQATGQTIMNRYGCVSIDTDVKETKSEWKIGTLWKFMNIRIVLFFHNNPPRVHDSTHIR